MLSGSTSVAEGGAVGDIRSPVEEEVVDVVIAASRVGSGILQRADVAEQKPECLLKSTEAISSSRLYSNTHTYTHTAEEEKREDREDRENRKNDIKSHATSSCYDYMNQNRVKQIRNQQNKTLVLQENVCDIQLKKRDEEMEQSNSDSSYRRRKKSSYRPSSYEL